MADITGKLFVVQKHMKGKRGKRTIFRRRKYYEYSEFGPAIEQAAVLAKTHGEDFVVVTVLGEASKPKKTNEELRLEPEVP